MIEDHRQPHPDHALVVGDQDPDLVTHFCGGSHACTLHPPKGPAATASVPPTAVARSRIPISPFPRPLSLPPGGLQHVHRWWATAAVVVDGEELALRPTLPGHPRRGGLRMHHHVGQRLLDDPYGGQVGGRGELTLPGRQVHRDVDSDRLQPLTHPGHVGQIRNRRGAAAGVGRLGARPGVQHPDGLPHRGQCFLAAGNDPADRLAQHLRSLVGHSVGRLSPDHDRAHVVRDHVVQVAGDPGALGDGGPLGRDCAQPDQLGVALLQDRDALAAPAGVGAEQHHAADQRFREDEERDVDVAVEALQIARQSGVPPAVQHRAVDMAQHDRDHGRQPDHQRGQAAHGEEAADQAPDAVGRGDVADHQQRRQMDLGLQRRVGDPGLPEHGQPELSGEAGADRGVHEGVEDSDGDQASYAGLRRPKAMVAIRKIPVTAETIGFCGRSQVPSITPSPTNQTNGHDGGHQQVLLALGQASPSGHVAQRSHPVLSNASSQRSGMSPTFGRVPASELILRAYSWPARTVPGTDVAIRGNPRGCTP